MAAIGLLVLALGALGLFLSARQSDAATEIEVLRAIGPTSSQLSLEEARSRLRNPDYLAPVIETSLSESPFWVAAQLPLESNSTKSILDLPSRHLVEFEIWLLTSQGEIILHTKGNRFNFDHSLIRRSDSGIAMTLPHTEAAPLTAIAKLTSVGPTKITARLWNENDFQEHMRSYERIGGILIGGLTLFGLFSSIIAFRTQQSIFILFTGWLITTLGVASLSTGHMHAWGGEFLPESLQILPRKAFIAACAVYTTALFRALFYRDLQKLRLTTAVELALYLAIGLCLLSASVSMERFIPFMWVSIVSGALLLIWCLYKIIRTGSVSAKWFALSWIATFAGSIAEIAFAMGILPSLPPALNNVGGAVMAALLMGAALSEQMKVDKERRRHAEQQAVVALSSYRDMYYRNPMPMWRVTKSGAIEQFNLAFTTLLGSCTERNPDIRSTPLDHLLGRGLTDSLFAQTSEDADVFSSEWVFVDDYQNKRWLSLSGTRDGECIEIAAQDITARKKAEETLRYLAEHDYLTGLPNRRALELWVKRWESDATSENSLTVTYLDLDRFKLINDLFGHNAGDEVLREVARRINSSIGKDAIVCRVGGDEFVIMHANTPHNEAVLEAQRLVATIGDTNYSIQGGNKAVTVTCSAGVIAADRTMPLRDIMATADAACHEAKNSGKHHVIAYHHSSQEVRGKLEEMRILEGFKDRPPKDRLQLFLQPIASTNPDAPLCAESLVRMLDQNGRLIHPTQFVSLAERNGMMSSIDYWVLEEAIKWLSSPKSPAATLDWLSVNFSATSLNDENFIAQTCELLAANSAATSRLCIEVTESSALIDLNYSKRILERFLELGAQVALDDFGAGYTSFRYLTQLPASKLKIDGGFIKDLLDRPDNRAVTKTIIGLARDLNMETVAEWVESPELLRATLALGVDYIQGYLVSRPIPANALNDQAAIIHSEFRRALLAQPKDAEQPASPIRVARPFQA